MALLTALKTGQSASTLGKAVRSQFPILSQKIDDRHPLIYLDNAATTQKPKVVIDAVTTFYEGSNANVNRGMHVLAERATDIYENARKRTQKFLNAKKPHEVIFTKGTTEGVNLISRSWGEANLKKGDVVLVSMLEHHSNIVPWLQLKEKLGIELQWIGIEANGTLKMDEAEAHLKAGNVKLLALTCVSNSLGVITPYKKLTKLAHEHGALVILDAAQLAAHAPIDVTDIDCDFLVFSPHKVYGTTGIGVLYGKEELLKKMPPFLGGGGMIQEVFTDHYTPAELPDKFEAGTPPIAEACALDVALEWFTNLGWKNVQEHEKDLITYALKKLDEISFVEVLGPKDPAKITGCISFLCHAEPGRSTTQKASQKMIHPHDLTEYIGKYGVCLRAGHHCTQPLHDALGHPATSRLSLAVYNTKEEIDRLCEAIKEANAFFTK
jgi:cysteine desulfurase/selenocysteine lyase